MLLDVVDACTAIASRVCGKFTNVRMLCFHNCRHHSGCLLADYSLPATRVLQLGPILLAILRLQTTLMSSINGANAASQLGTIFDSHCVHVGVFRTSIAEKVAAHFGPRRTMLLQPKPSARMP